MVIHKLVQSGRLNANQIAILYLIASYSGGCWLSATGFCRKLHINRKTFFKEIKFLVENRLVAAQKKPGSRNYYWINSKENQEWWLQNGSTTSTVIATGTTTDPSRLST